MHDSSSSPLPVLRGLRIVEASAFVAAPLGGMTLAQLGADVIRIDPPGGGLDYRRWPVTEDNTSLFWCGLNKGKRSVVIDLASPEGRELAMDLICAPGPGVFMHRAAWERAGSWSAALHQIPDFEYWLRLGLEGDFKRIPEALAAYRVHNQSQSFAPVSIERAEETLDVISGHLGSPRVPPAIVGAKDEALSSAHIVTARFHLRSGRYRDALRHLLAAVRLHPRSYLRARTWRLVVNGLFNRLGHRIFWTLRSKASVGPDAHG